MDISLNFTAKALGTDAYGDLMVSNGDLQLTADATRAAADATNPIAQSAAQKIRTLLGEYFLNTSLGVPYYQELFGQKQRSVAFEQALQNVILSTPGVLQLVDWKAVSKPAERRLEITFRAQTTAGLVVWSGRVNPQPGGTGV